MVKVLTGAYSWARPKEEQFQVWLQNPPQAQTQDKAEKLSGRNKPLLEPPDHMSLDLYKRI